MSIRPFSRALSAKRSSIACRLLLTASNIGINAALDDGLSGRRFTLPMMSVLNEGMFSFLSFGLIAGHNIWTFV
jgi:hypothetical protein